MLPRNVDTELPKFQKRADLMHIAAEATQGYEKFSSEDSYICISDKLREKLEIS